MKKAIPPELHAWCVAEFNRGQTSEQIAEALWREHKVEVTSRTVRKLLQKHRSELADVAKGLIRERLQKQLNADLDSLEQLHESAINQERRALKIARDLRAIHPQHPEALKYETFALKAKDRRLRAINLVLHYSGAGEPDQPDLLKPDQRSELFRRLERLITAETQPDPGPKDEPPKVH
jgi:hypothetical protein